MYMNVVVKCDQSTGLLYLTNQQICKKCEPGVCIHYFSFFWWVDPAAEHVVIRTSKRELHTWTTGRFTSRFQAHRLVFILIRPLYLFTDWTLTVNSPAPQGHAPPSALPMFYKYLLLFFFYISTARIQHHICICASRFSSDLTDFYFAVSNHIKNRVFDSVRACTPAPSDVSSLLMSLRFHLHFSCPSTFYFKNMCNGLVPLLPEKPFGLRCVEGDRGDDGNKEDEERGGREGQDKEE